MNNSANSIFKKQFSTHVEQTKTENSDEAKSNNALLPDETCPTISTTFTLPKLQHLQITSTSINYTSTTMKQLNSLLFL